MTARVQTVNVGLVRPVPWGRKKSSAIDKRPTNGPVRVGPLGLSGDEIADLVHHGGADQAVYAYAREDLDAWAAELGRDLGNGVFGENLTTVGLDLQEARMGERWAVGSTVLEVCSVRIPCSVFGGFLDERQWVRRFTQHGIPGAYLRVIQEGALEAGDEIVVVERPDHDLTVARTFRALTTEQGLLRDFPEEPRLAARVRQKVDAVRNEGPR